MAVDETCPVCMTAEIVCGQWTMLLVRDPRVEYALTEKGMALLPIIDDMRAYGEEWLAAQCAEGAESGDPEALAVA
jgi:DNA-binding HxlR family transcriptional regulator